jgi:arsenite methyltransferase
MKSFSNAIVERYDKLSGQDCCLSCGKALSFAPVQPGDTCVDLGSGQGHDVLRMAIMTGPKGFVYGVDISDGMMDMAKQNASKLKLDHVAFIKCPLEEINLNTEQADVLISNCTINHSLNQARVWQEISRILKPGACFVVSDIYAIETVPEVYANDPAAVSECWAGAVTKDKYIEHMINAGLTGLEILEESIPYDKGKVQVASFTVRGIKPKKS